MATIYTANKVTSGDFFFGHAWYATRTMLKAGWLLKNSSNASSKATINSGSNPADPTNCMWGAPATITGQSGSLASIGAQFGKDFLITGLTGLVTASNTNSGGSEGNILTVVSASSSGSNVNWMITRVIDSTQCYARPLVPSAVVSSGSAPPMMSIVGHLARTRLFSLKVETVATGALGTAQIKISLDGGSTFASAVTIPATGFVEVIDNNNVATGIYLVFGGTINNINNSWTSSTAAPNDSNNGAISWTEKSWLTTSYPSLGTYAWIVLEGPATLKIPFTSSPVGTFIRGENIVQSSTGAEGEMMGITYDSTGGYIVISPRLQGTGTGAEGWDSGYTITGASSGATITASAKPTRLVREQVWTRGSMSTSQNGNGALFYQPVLDATENSQRFGWLSLQSGCTAGNPPGCGSSGPPYNNVFPSVGYAIVGRGSAGVTTAPVGGVTSNVAWHGTGNSSGATGRMQLFTANCIDRQGLSCDGSLVGVVGMPSISAVATGCLPIFMRLDGGEEGDIEPYASWTIKSRNNFSSRIKDGNDNLSGDNYYVNEQVNSPWYGAAWGYGITVQGFIATMGWWASWWRRGLTSAQFPSTVSDTYVDLIPTLPYVPAIASYLQVYANNTTTDLDTVSHSVQTSPPAIFQPIEMAAQAGQANLNYTASAVNIAARKGYLRWLFLTTGTNGSTAFDTFANKAWMQCENSYGANILYGLKIVMPYDGSSTPLQ